MKSVQRNDYKSGVIRSCIKRRVPIHFGSVSDPFQPIERKYQISFELLKILRQFSYPTVISTKSDLLINKRYLKLISEIPVIVQYSLSTLNAKLAAKIEPNSTSPANRLRALYILSKKNIKTIVRLQPLLIRNKEDIAQAIKKISDVGVNHVILEHLRIPTNSPLKDRKKLWEALEFNYLDFYKGIGIRKSRISYELCTEMKLENLMEIRELCHDHGMSFSSGDNDLHHLSDLYCCCGVMDKGNFSNLYNGHLGYVAFEGIRSGKLDFSIIDNSWQPSGSIKEFINSQCRSKNCRTAKDFLRLRTNSVDKSNSPDDFFGIEYSDEKGYYINKRILKKNKINFIG